MRDEGLKSKGRSQKSKIKSLILKIRVNLWQNRIFALFVIFAVSVLRALRVLRGSN